MGQRIYFDIQIQSDTFHHTGADIVAGQEAEQIVTVFRNLRVSKMCDGAIKPQNQVIVARSSTPPPKGYTVFPNSATICVGEVQTCEPVGDILHVSSATRLLISFVKVYSCRNLYVNT